MRKRKQPRLTAQTPKICNKCGVENVASANECDKCGSTRFAPDWVIAMRRINRQVSVEITRSNAQYGDVYKRITLSKWWPGHNTTFHIPNPQQWNRIETIINDELMPLLGWKPKAAMLADVRTRKQEDKDLTGELKRLLQQYPEFLGQVAASADQAKLKEADLDQLGHLVDNLTKVMSKATEGFKDAFFRLVEKLPKQGQRALEDLEMLLHNWSLHQITGVTQQVKSRLETIEVFEKQIHYERTFEIRGAGSIHRILERAMWLIDERYWLLQSNASLLKFIGDEMEKSDRKRFGRKRPDFACGTVGDRLVVIELKRPSHALTIEDLNQLETYLTLAEKYKSYRSYEAWLVGNKKSADLMSRLKYRGGTFKVATYSDLLDDTRHRYKDFLNVIDESAATIAKS